MLLLAINQQGSQLERDHGQIEVGRDRGVQRRAPVARPEPAQAGLHGKVRVVVLLLGRREVAAGELLRDPGHQAARLAVPPLAALERRRRLRHRRPPQHPVDLGHGGVVPQQGLPRRREREDGDLLGGAGPAPQRVPAELVPPGLLPVAGLEARVLPGHGGHAGAGVAGGDEQGGGKEDEGDRRCSLHDYWLIFTWGMKDGSPFLALIKDKYCIWICRYLLECNK